MRLHAYVLAGDPAWIPESIGSYYGLVDRIVVSYDRSFRSWTGRPMSVEQSLARITSIDRDGKVMLVPGDHAFSDRPVMQVETEQRQGALDAASDGADWVLQLDTDEIVLSPPALERHLRSADSRAADALDYPLRDIYARASGRRFLEHCGRFWTHQAAYPGPVAVRAGTRLAVARQPRGAALHRVDLSPWNTDPAHPSTAPVHAVVRPDEAVLHLSWVRTPEQMAEKALVSGYAANRDWTRDLGRWARRARRPWLTAAAAPFTASPFDRYRVTRLPMFDGGNT